MNIVTLQSPYGAAQQVPTRIVLHALGEFIDDGHRILPAHDFLQHNRLSVHALATPSGVIIRERNDLQGAHHARGFNKNSLGIEFLVPGIHDYSTFLAAIRGDYLTNSAFNAGVDQVREWIRLYEIVSIDTHRQLDPGRKQDPGRGFPLERFIKAVNGG